VKSLIGVVSSIFVFCTCVGACFSFCLFCVVSYVCFVHLLFLDNSYSLNISSHIDYFTSLFPRPLKTGSGASASTRNHFPLVFFYLNLVPLKSILLIPHHYFCTYSHPIHSYSLLLTAIHSHLRSIGTCQPSIRRHACPRSNPHHITHHITIHLHFVIALTF
jgi:hypothetical protein